MTGVIVLGSDRSFDLACHEVVEVVFVLVVFFGHGSVVSLLREIAVVFTFGVKVFAIPVAVAVALANT